MRRPNIIDRDGNRSEQEPNERTELEPTCWKESRDTQYNGTGNSSFFTDFRFRAWTAAQRGGK